METSNSQTAQIIEVNADMPVEVSCLGGNKTCGGAACDFSDSKTSSKDAKERSASMRKLLVAVMLCIIFMSVEVAGGIKANSLAILTDAAHLLSDVASFAISLFALWASGWEATPQQSYGFFRAEMLGALVSIQLIWLLSGILVYEAIARIIYENGEVDGFLMFAVAAFGLLVNIVMAVVLGHDHGHAGDSHGHGGHSHSHGVSEHDHSHHGNDHDHDDLHGVEQHNHGHGISITTHHHHSKEDILKDEHEPLHKHSEDSGDENSGLEKTQENNEKKQRNINVHSAYLHVLGDSIQSIGVMIGGAIIWCKPEWKIIDLICTFLFSVVVLLTTIKMLRNILEVLMESTPREIDATRLEKGLCEMDGVVAIHELHIWAITMGKVLLACHVTITPEADADRILDEVIGYIRREYNISHVTIQIERL
ncbi:metal tolerance protein 1 isoform X2 [Elaeis guineensis]|uniref:Metal tolerance protein 1 n=2 Tax=Elaeis guineensis var. tenera TaxID=51953 RepID=A0A6I9S6D9_ELAGV|nr:metal tolerance protein 1 [Elaeis guineensis]